jgi:hypothetical protein
VQKCDDEALAKLWHYRLGHILRGRIERLIKEDILHSLEFSNSEYCIDCIKGKYVRACLDRLNWSEFNWILEATCLPANGIKSLNSIHFQRGPNPFPDKTDGNAQNP